MIRLPRLTTAAERAEVEAQRLEAAESFALLRGLDLISGQKVELAAAGIPRHTIDSLYPETEFAAIASQLILRLPQLNAGTRYSMSLFCQEAFEFEQEKLKQLAANAFWDGWSAAQADAGARAELAAAIDQLILLQSPEVQLPHRDDATLPPSYLGASIVNVCWWSWWLMTNRSQLPRKVRPLADRLMLVTDFAFELLPAEEILTVS